MPNQRYVLISDTVPVSGRSNPNSGTLPPSYQRLTKDDLPVVPVSLGGTGSTTPSGSINALLPSQAGNAGKFLQTDGVNVSWQTSTGGTVTNFSSGNLSPLFTTIVATSSTTPALSFALTNAGANTWFGNNTGLSAPPAYNPAGTISKVDDTNVTLTLGGTPINSILNSVSFTLGWVGVLSETRGGTNQSTYATGDILYASAANTISKLPIGMAGQVLTIVAGIPAWVANGSGTVTSFSAGSLSPLFTTSVATATTTPALSFSLSTAGANTYFGNSTGGVAAPSYTAAAALTVVDDTNVTLTLGGSHATALLKSASLTLGWTGVLSTARGGTGTSTVFSPGSVIFADGSGDYTQDANVFFYDAASSRLGIGTNAPTHGLTVDGDAKIFTDFFIGTCARLYDGGIGVLNSDAPVKLNSTLEVIGLSTLAATTATQITVPQIYGSAAASGNLTLTSTSDTTKGFTYIGTTTTVSVDETNKRIGIGIAAPTAYLNIAGSPTGAANTAAIKFNSATTLLATPEAGAIEFQTDNLFLTITTGAARKNITLWNTLGTSSRVPFATTNGRLLDDSTFTFAPSTGISVINGATLGYVTKAANYTLTLTDHTVEVTTGTNNQTLPTAVGITGRHFEVINSGTGVVTVNTTSSQTINGQLTKTLNQNEAIILRSNGSNWVAVSNTSTSSPVSYNGELTPSAITGATNNYNPTGLSQCNFLRLSSTGNFNITGLQAPSPLTNQAIYVCNVGANTITLTESDAASTAGNRFLLAGSKNLQPDEGIQVIYDKTTLRWRSQSTNI